MKNFLRQQFAIHGKHELFRVWRSAMMRNLGVDICEEWKDFPTFAAAIGERPDFRSFIRKKNPSLLLGPANFYWRGNPKPDAEQRKKNMYSRNTEWGRKRRNNDPLYATKANIKNQYGLSWEDYERMVVEQGGLCACCEQKPTVFRNKKHRLFDIDHDHKTGEVRGLCCHWCNIMIGQSLENPARLRKGAEYLERHSAKTLDTKIIPFPSQEKA